MTGARPQMQGSAYCREIEAYLCRKNDGHLIRVVGPAFELVSGWATDGVPLKVAFRGIDRYFERYYRKGPRRRPVRVDFCAADVLEVFDEWRRAVGLGVVTSVGTREGGTALEAGRPEQKGPSLARHLERVLQKVTNLSATGVLDGRFDALIDRLAGECERARGAGRGLRGDLRRAALDRLAALDAEFVQSARSCLDASTQRAFEREADEELSGYRATMAPGAWRRVHEAAVDRLIREHLSLPVIRLTSPE